MDDQITEILFGTRDPGFDPDDDEARAVRFEEERGGDEDGEPGQRPAAASTNSSPPRSPPARRPSPPPGLTDADLLAAVTARFGDPASDGRLLEIMSHTVPDGAAPTQRLTATEVESDRST